MAAGMRPGKEKDQASEEEEEEEEEGGGGCWEYDSTWEEEEEEGRQEKKESGPASQAANLEEAKTREKHSWPLPSTRWASGSQDWRSPGVKKWKSINRRNWNAARDLQKYRRHYPGLEEIELSEEEMWNLSFYKNEINFLPRGLYIENLLELWQDNYAVLEENHSYIQWDGAWRVASIPPEKCSPLLCCNLQIPPNHRGKLWQQNDSNQQLFPLREQGMNFHAKRLTRQEIKAFKKSKEVMERFIRAYKLMLGFYGINLINEETGELRRAENWCERFGNLNRYSHNNLRITRILKCLGEMGYEHHQVQLVKFFLIETLVYQQLPRVLRSALDYFMFTIRNKPKRQELVYFAWQHFKPKHEFVWGPRKKLQRFRPQSPMFLSNPEEQAHTKKGDGEVMEKDDIESTKIILRRLTEKSGQEGTRETVEKEKNGLPEEKCVAEQEVDTTINHKHTYQPASNVSAKLSLIASDPAQDKGSRRRVTSVEGDDLLQEGDIVEPLMKLVGDCKTSRKANQPHLPLVTIAKAEKEDNEEGTVSSDCPLERKDRADECSDGADGESLKESKKRKLEMSRLSGESPGVSKSPSDIEKISHNLGEVVITKEEINFLAPEGGKEDSRDGKEVESLDEAIKRRKVDIAPKGGSSEVHSEVIPSKGQGTSCVTHDVKKTDLVCQEETKIAAIASVDILTGHRTGGVDVLVDSNKNDFPVDGCLLEKVNEQEASTLTDGKAAWLSETLIAHERGVRDNAGWKEQHTEETSDGSTGKNKAPNVREHENAMAGPEEE